MKFTRKDLEDKLKAGKIRGIVDQAAAAKKGPAIPGKIIGKKFSLKSRSKQKVEHALKDITDLHGLQLVGELQFHKAHLEEIGDTKTKPRKFRFDWSIREWKLAIEYDGGVYDTHGSHRSRKDTVKDANKINLAGSLGWTVIRFNALNADTVTDVVNQFITNKKSTT